MKTTGTNPNPYKGFSRITGTKLFKKKYHCSGCTETDSWDTDEGRTHQMDTIKHPLRPVKRTKKGKLDKRVYSEVKKWTEAEWLIFERGFEEGYAIAKRLYKSN